MSPRSRKCCEETKALGVHSSGVTVLYGVVWWGQSSQGTLRDTRIQGGSGQAARWQEHPASPREGSAKAPGQQGAHCSGAGQLQSPLALRVCVVLVREQEAGLPTAPGAGRCGAAAARVQHVMCWVCAASMCTYIHASPAWPLCTHTEERQAPVSRSEARRLSEVQ